MKYSMPTFVINEVKSLAGNKLLQRGNQRVQILFGRKETDDPSKMVPTGVLRGDDGLDIAFDTIRIIPAGHNNVSDIKQDWKEQNIAVVGQKDYCRLKWITDIVKNEMTNPVTGHLPCMTHQSFKTIFSTKAAPENVPS